MSEIAAVIAIVVSLVALWLANNAHKQVNNTFGNVGKHLAKQVKDAQDSFTKTVEKAQREVRATERSLESLEQQQRETAANVNTLSQRLKVIEHELNSLTEALPPKYRKVTEKKAGGSGGGTF